MEEESKDRRAIWNAMKEINLCGRSGGNPAHLCNALDLLLPILEEWCSGDDANEEDRETLEFAKAALAAYRSTVQ